MQLTAARGKGDTQAAPRDPAWLAEVEHETLHAVLEREATSLPASIVAWAVLVIAAVHLPYFNLLLVPLGFRLASLFATRRAAQNLRQAVIEGRALSGPHAVLTATLGIAGISWALLLYPHAIVTAPDPSVVAMRGIAVVGVAMLAVTFGPLKWPMFALLAGFSLTLSSFVILHREVMSLWLIAAIVALATGIAVYSLGAARQHRRAARMIVDNRFLSEELADALAQAEFLSRHDPLTGLLNRRAFFETDCPPSECEESRFLLTIDLDHFKTVNDEHGHATGDVLLVATANIIRELARPIGTKEHRAVRLGGEEFVLLLVGVERAAAGAMAEALRKRIERIPAVNKRPSGVSVTASIGLTEYRSGEKLDDVLRRSDLAMYRAKDRGRNQVVSEAA
ncbi:MAG: diguanylate cyclase [Altererythrobacter sp.]